MTLIDTPHAIHHVKNTPSSKTPGSDFKDIESLDGLFYGKT